MMYLAADTEWTNTVLIVAVLLVSTILIGGLMGMFLDLRKAKIAATRDEELRQLVNRYEKLAENTQDAQQRVAADISELRSRTASIEQILSTVE